MCAFERKEAMDTGRRIWVKNREDESYGCRDAVKLRWGILY
jgi:hypothetical protein